MKSFIGITAKDDVLCASLLLKEKERVFFFTILSLLFSVNLVWMERSRQEISNTYCLVIFRVTVEL